MGNACQLKLSTNNSEKHETTWSTAWVAVENFKGFQKCYASNNLNGTQDYVMWVDNGKDSTSYMVASVGYD